MFTVQLVVVVVDVLVSHDAFYLFPRVHSMVPQLSKTRSVRSSAAADAGEVSGGIQLWLWRSRSSVSNRLSD